MTDQAGDGASASSPPTPAPSPTPTFYSTHSRLQQSLLKDGSPKREAFGGVLPLTGAALYESMHESYRALSGAERASYIKYLLAHCGRDVLAEIQAFVDPLLKRDPFAVLPNELSLRILSYIDDPTTLARASQVSRLWYLILSDDLTWKELCKSHHFRRLSAAMNIHHSSRLRSRLSSVVAGGPEGGVVDPGDLAEVVYDPEATRQPVPRSYRSHFKQQYLLNAAWRAGGRLAARYAIASPTGGVVTCLAMAGKYIVIALDNSKIFVFREDGKMLRSLFGHVMGVWALTLRGDTLVSGGCDRDVRVWSLKSGACTQILRGHSSTVRCLQMADSAVDGVAEVAVSGSRDHTLKVWDLARGVCLRTLQGHTSSVRCVEVVGDICVSGSYDFTARVWRVSTGECLHTLAGHFSQIYCLAFDGKRVATGSLDASVRIWDVESGQCVAVLQGHTSLVGQIQLRGDTLVTGGSDGAVRVWDLTTFECVQRLAAHDNSVTTLQFDDSRIVSGGSDGRVRVWDLATGGHVRDLSAQFDAVWRVAFRDDKIVILASKSNRVYMELTSFMPPRDEIEDADNHSPLFGPDYTAGKNPATSSPEEAVDPKEDPEQMDLS
ncbi:hypothetical protein TRICI_003695 [Trichomonascus ciferrii]|uniref:F-box domain-containing protein n=1 Tax=Trichomonascus ciferrii TaxID=44093 RepID=A0A642V331_9ASCO|nr:hypothetical protein TRICI_003695 [Trichomonascus ciferrii]